jgi:hypothetical protein
MDRPYLSGVRYPSRFARGALTGRLAALLFLCFLALPAFAAQVPVRDGQSVPLKLRSILTTDNVQKGDTVEFEVAQDVLINGHVVFAKGAIAHGKILEIKGAFKPRAKDAEVIFKFVSVQAADRQDLPLRTQSSKAGKGKGEDIHERSPIPGQISRVVGADKGKEYTAYIDGSFSVRTSDTIGAAPAAPVATPASTPAAAPTAPAVAASPLAASDMAMTAEPSSVDFASTPDGADIVIDGNMVGNTPSTLRLTPGHHAIEIRMAGYRTWSRNMVVDPESHPSVRATLVKQ